MANVSSSNGLEKRPKLRFPGFDEPWCMVELGRKLIPYSETTTENNQYPPLTSSRKGLFLQTDYFNRQVASEDNIGYNIVPYGFFTYRHMSDDLTFYFNINEIVENGIVSTLYPVFTTTADLNSHFLRAYLNHSRRFASYCVLQKQGGSRTYMYFKKLCAHNAIIPPKKEQEKISAFIDLLDQRIKLQEEKIECLKKYKRGVTESIFNKSLQFTINGISFPQWDENNIGEVCKIQTGKSNTQDETDQGSYPFYVRSPIVRKSNRYLFDCEAVLTVGDGVGTGKVFHYITGKFDLHQRVYAMTDFKTVSGKYFYYYFSHFFYDRVMRMTAKTSVDSVRYEMIDKMTIQVPCKEEQHRIVSFLDFIEQRISGAEKTLNLLENLKSGCLQQLFI